MTAKQLTNTANELNKQNVRAGGVPAEANVLMISISMITRVTIASYCY